MGPPNEFRMTYFVKPVPKQRPRTYRTKGKVRTLTPVETQQFETAIRMLTISEIHRQGLDVPVFGKEPVSVTLEMQPTRGDFDNVAKAVIDALNEVLWVDDRQIRHADITVHRKGNPRISIAVTKF